MSNSSNNKNNNNNNNNNNNSNNRTFSESPYKNACRGPVPKLDNGADVAL